MTELQQETLGADPPPEGVEARLEPSEAVSGAQDAPQAVSGDHPASGEEGVLRQTAPVFVTEMVVAGHMHWLQRTPGGGMQLKLVAASPVPQGAPRLHMPAYVFEFTAEGWEKFKRTVETDGEVPAVEIATHLPPPPIPRG